MSNEVDEFLKGLDNSPKDDPFTPTADPLTAPVKEEVVEEKVPFHEDPKIQKFIKREVEKRVSEIKPTEVERFVTEVKKDEEDEMSAVLTRIIGNDTPEKISAIKDFKRALGNIEEKGAQKALAQLAEQANEERQAEVEAQNELVTGFENIENKFEVDLTSNTAQARKERSEFVDFIKRVSPKDEDGQVIQFPDLEETYQLFKETRKPESNSRAKELSSRSMSRSGDASSAKPQTGTSWRDVDKLFSRFNS